MARRPLRKLYINDTVRGIPLRMPVHSCHLCSIHRMQIDGPTHSAWIYSSVITDLGPSALHSDGIWPHVDARSVLCGDCCLPPNFAAVVRRPADDSPLMYRLRTDKAEGRGALVLWRGRRIVIRTARHASTPSWSILWLRLPRLLRPLRVFRLLPLPSWATHQPARM